MTVSERQRLQLHERLGDTLGRENAEVLMEYLPPVGWSDVARQHDVENVRAEMRTGFADLRAEMHQLMNRHLVWVVSTNLACVGAVLGLIADVD